MALWTLIVSVPSYSFLGFVSVLVVIMSVAVYNLGRSVHCLFLLPRDVSPCYLAPRQYHYYLLVYCHYNALFVYCSIFQVIYFVYYQYFYYLLCHYLFVLFPLYVFVRCLRHHYHCCLCHYLCLVCYYLQVPFRYCHCL